MGVIFGYRKAAERICVWRLRSLVTAKIFSIGANPKRIDTMKQVKMAAREIADKHGVKSEDDIVKLRKACVNHTVINYGTVVTPAIGF